LIKLISIQIISFVLLKLENRKKLNIIRTLFLAVDLVVNLNGRSKFVIFVCETVKSKVGKIMCCEFKLMCIHSYELTNTIQEENEKRRVILAVVDVLPSLHLDSRGFDIS